MTSNSTKPDLLHPRTDTAVQVFDWFDPIEAGVRGRVRDFIQAMIDAELEEVLARPRYGRRANRQSSDVEVPAAVIGHRHGRRPRSLMATFHARG
jgi:hypothetical protein